MELLSNCHKSHFGELFCFEACKVKVLGVILSETGRQVTVNSTFFFQSWRKRVRWYGVTYKIKITHGRIYLGVGLEE